MEPPPAPAAPKKGHGRRRIPPNLPRIRIEHDLSDAEKICPCCGESLAAIGEETSEQLDYEPASLFVCVHARKKYACKRCQDHVITADKPAEPIDKGLPGAGLLAHVATSKYADHLPLYRLEGILARHGVEISRKTMCDWMARVADLLEPITMRMRALVLQSKVIHTDDTPVPVQDPSCPKKTKTGRLWTYLGDAEHPYTLFDFTPTRSREGPEEWLDGYQGYLQADAFSGYDAMFKLGHVIEVACWAHARRKFFEAKSTDAPRAHQMLAFIGQLYDIERKAKELDDDRRLSLRQEVSSPILNQIGTWLDDNARSALPKSPIGQAIAYARSNWAALNRYLEAGYLAIDNNAAERAIKNIVIGRKNYLFCGSDEGGRTAATIYSITVTCKRLGLDPFRYFRDVLAAVSTHPAKDLDELLPDRWAAKQSQIS
jgi:transposase